MRINGFVVILLLLCAKNTSAQRFGARAVAGWNMSQVSGDQMAGFDKFSFTGGLHGVAQLTDRMELNVEFLYSARGSRANLFNPNIDPDISISLKYIDLPVYISYRDWYDEEEKYYKAFAFGGFSYGRLLSASAVDNFNEEEANIESLVNDFNENDFSWLIGFGFRLSKRFEIQFRYTSSINLLLDAEKLGIDAFSLRSYFITVRGEYIF